MKNLLTLILFVLTAYGSYGQTVVSQNVSLSSGSPDNTSGCSSIRLIVNYTYGGLGYSVASSTVTLSEGGSTTLTATVPALRGATITSKVLRISAPNGTYYYTITGTTNYEDNFNPICYCDSDIRSKILMINETATNIDYLFTHDLCCPSCN